MAKTKPPAVQVLFEPWPVTQDGHVWDRAGYAAFAGVYWIDALDADGMLTPRGYRGMVAGCTTCRRDEANDRAHVPNINDLPGEKRRRTCPTWRTIEKVVKTFGGWKRTHYVELAEHEGLKYQSLQGRAVNCPDCRSPAPASYPLCERCGGWYVAAEGPKLPDRWRMSEIQRHMRRPEQV